MVSLIPEEKLFLLTFFISVVFLLALDGADVGKGGVGVDMSNF